MHADLVNSHRKKPASSPRRRGPSAFFAFNKLTTLGSRLRGNDGFDFAANESP
jgi:hypothetical protein